jgi:hypothetical protein
MASTNSTGKAESGEKSEVEKARHPTIIGPAPSPEEEKLANELRDIFLDLLTSSQKLSYELATMDVKDEYTREELRDLLNACRSVVVHVKRMHRFFEKYGRRT